MNTFSSFSLFILSTLKVSIYQCYKKTKINIMMNLRALEKKKELCYDKGVNPKEDITFANICACNITAQNT